MISRFASAMLASTALAFSAPAFANFEKDPDPGGVKFFIDVANEDADHFFGNVGGNGEGPVVRVDTVGLVDTGSGYANIKPVKDGTLTYLMFTPEDPNLFGDFSFRGQLERGALGTVTLEVQDNQGNGPQTFTFEDLGNGNFERVGIVTTDNETIKWIKLYSDFKEVKQIDFSYAAPIPEPESYALMLAGLGVLGFVARRRKTA